MPRAAGKNGFTRSDHQSAFPSFFHPASRMRATHGDSNTSCTESAGGASDTSAPMLTPDDYTTLPTTHPSQQLLKASFPESAH